MPISRSLLDLSFGVPSKGALPPSFPRRPPSLRGALFPDPFSFIPLWSSPLDLYGERCPSSEPSFTYPSESPVKETSSRFPSQSSYRERCCVFRALVQLSEKFPVNATPPSRPPVFPNRPYGGRCPSLEPSSTCKSLLNDPPSRLPNMAITEYNMLSCVILYK